jgi:hypothetical protein
MKKIDEHMPESALNWEHTFAVKEVSDCHEIILVFTPCRESILIGVGITQNNASQRKVH